MWVVVLGFIVVLTIYTIGREDGKAYNIKKLEFLINHSDKIDKDHE